MRSGAVVTATGQELDERERRLLDFERDWTLHRGCKERAIKDRFGFSAARYYQLIARVVDRPEALAYDPLTVRRVRRRRDLAKRRAAAVDVGRQP